MADANGRGIDSCQDDSCAPSVGEHARCKRSGRYPSLRGSCDVIFAAACGGQDTRIEPVHPDILLPSPDLLPQVNALTDTGGEDITGLSANRPRTEAAVRAGILPPGKLGSCSAGGVPHKKVADIPSSRTPRKAAIQ